MDVAKMLMSILGMWSIQPSPHAVNLFHSVCTIHAEPLWHKRRQRFCTGGPLHTSFPSKPVHFNLETNYRYSAAQDWTQAMWVIVLVHCMLLTNRMCYCIKFYWLGMPVLCIVFRIYCHFLHFRVPVLCEYIYLYSCETQQHEKNTIDNTIKQGQILHIFAAYCLVMVHIFLKKLPHKTGVPNW